jgi:uncharacterized protein
MPSALFFVRFVPNRPDFIATMTPQEAATMGAHVAFLNEQLAAGTLVVAGPVLDPSGPFGMAVFEAATLADLQSLLSKDPALAIGRHEIAPMAPNTVRRSR